MFRLNWYTQDIPKHILRAHGGAVPCRGCSRRMTKELRVIDLGPWTVPMIIEDLRKQTEPILTHHLRQLCQFCFPLD